MPDDVTLAHLDTRAARHRFERLVAVYLEVYAGDDRFHGEDRYRHQLASHLTAPGWAMVTASVGDELVGYVYGFPPQAADRSWAGLVTPLPAEYIREDGRRSFDLCELLVRRAWRRRHIATALHDEILRDRPEERANLLVEPDNAPAQAAYAKWGWRKVGELRPPRERAPLFDVLILPLPHTPGSPAA